MVISRDSGYKFVIFISKILFYIIFLESHQILWFCCTPKESYEEDNLHPCGTGLNYNLASLWRHSDVFYLLSPFAHQKFNMTSF